MADFTTNNLIKFFKDVPGDEVGIGEVMHKTGFKRPTVMNYVRDLTNQGLITQIRSDAHKLKVQKIKLTEAGAVILNTRSAGAVTSQVVPEDHDPMLDEIAELELLDRSTEITDEFNRRSSKWEWIMIRKGAASHK